jgi:hypothetical protein
VEQQHELNSRNYHYQPRDAVVRQHYQEQVARPASSRQESPQQIAPRQQDVQRANPPASQQQGGLVAPRPQSPQKGEDDGKRPAPTQQAPVRQRDLAVDAQKPPPQAVQREQQTPRSGQENTQRGKGASQDSRQEQENAREKEREKDRDQREERRQERNR